MGSGRNSWIVVGIRYKGFRQLPTNSYRIRWGEIDLRDYCGPSLEKVREPLDKMS